jgi:hypothetical protein
MTRYSNYLNRVRVVEKNTETLIKTIKELEEANKKLRKIVEGYPGEVAARERVLQSITAQYAPHLGKEEIDPHHTTTFEK